MPEGFCRCRTSFAKAEAPAGRRSRTASTSRATSSCAMCSRTAPGPYRKHAKGLSTGCAAPVDSPRLALVTTDALAMLFPNVTVTRGIAVRVAVSYLVEQSDPSTNRWFWSYHVRIENGSEVAVQLLS